jgi:hypothetical protein
MLSHPRCAKRYHACRQTNHNESSTSLRAFPNPCPHKAARKQRMPETPFRAVVVIVVARASKRTAQCSQHLPISQRKLGRPLRRSRFRRVKSNAHVIRALGLVVLHGRQVRDGQGQSRCEKEQHHLVHALPIYVGVSNEVYRKVRSKR